MKNVHRPASSSRQSGFSLVEMIGVLAIIAILAVVIVPKVFSTIASSRVTSAIGSVNSMKTAVTDFAGKYGTVPYSVAASRIDDLLVTAGLLDTRFLVKVGTQPGATALAGATWSNATGTWVATGGVNQTTQSRIICLISAQAAVPGATGNNYRLDGVATNNLPASARVVSAVIAGVPLNDAREMSLKIDGDTMTEAVGAATADTRGKVAYAAPATAGALAGTTTVYIYLVHQ